MRSATRPASEAEAGALRRGRPRRGRQREPHRSAGGAGASPLFIVLKSLAIVNLRNSCKYAVVKRAVRACTVRS